MFTQLLIMWNIFYDKFLVSKYKQMYLEQKYHHEKLRGKIQYLKEIIEYADSIKG